MSLSLFDLVSVTLKSLSSNPLRSALTTLGIFMGVVSVSATLQVGSISRVMIEDELAQREAPHIFMGLWGVKGREATLEDLVFFRQQLNGLKAISAVNFVWELGSPTVFQGQEAEPNVLAISPSYLLTSGRRVLTGRAFTSADFSNFRQVVIIDQYLGKQLFQNQDPIGKIIFIGYNSFLVVGVIETKFDPEEEEPNGGLLIPMSTYSSLTGKQRILGIQMRPYKLKDMKKIEDQAKDLFKQRFPDSEFFAQNNVEDILQQRETFELASRGLAAVGIISLLIGGVGIANITIAAVMERTSEIGLRRALGATQNDILWQFILEAVLLSFIGGVAAIVTVHGLTLAVANTFKLPYEFKSNIAILSLSSALLVGVGAGFIPALRASQIEPVKALRSD